MNIQGISSNTGSAPQFCQIQPGKEKAVEQAAEDNQLDKLVVKNQQGSFLIYGQDLQLAHEYANQDGLSFRTLPTGFVGAPQKGERIVLGDLKGELAFFDDKINRYQKAGEIGTWGGAIGGAFLGMVSVHSSDALMSGLLGGTIGFMFGGMIAIGATALVAKPNYAAESMTQNCLPTASPLPQGSLAQTGLVN
jgi:hypothetical protein